MIKILDWFIPRPVAASGGDEARKARITVVFSLAMLLATIPNAIILLTGGVRTVGFLVVAVIIAQAVTPLLLRATGSVRFAAQFLVTVSMLDELADISLSGGLESPGLVWSGSYVVFAIMVLGTRVGAIWSALTVVSCATFLILGKLGIPVPNHVAHLDRGEALMASYTTALIAFYLLVRSYENLKTRMLREIEDARNDIQAAHDRARLVLDNVSQGLVMVDHEGRIEKGCSRAVEQWFGPIGEREDLFAYLGRSDRRLAEWLNVSWSTIFDGVLPLEVVVAQLPAHCHCGNRHYELAYRPIGSCGAVTSVLLVISDDSARVEAEAAREEQRDALVMFRRISEDRDIVMKFMEESRLRIEALLGPGLDHGGQLREIHTLKGNLGLYGLSRSARFFHRLEDKLVDDERDMDEAERRRLADHWHEIEAMVVPLLGDPTSVQLSRSEYDDAMAAVSRKETHGELWARMSAWRLEPVRKRFALLSQHIMALAERLGKPGITVSMDDGGVRLPPEKMARFWSVFTHLTRNAVDHGIETPQERSALGKPAGGVICLASRTEADGVTIEIADDGRGIDWATIAERAEAKGLPAKSHRDLERALFADGISGKESTSIFSGRGVGLAAVHAAVLDIGGGIGVESTPGHGTRFSFRLKIAGSCLTPDEAGAGQGAG